MILRTDLHRAVFTSLIGFVLVLAEGPRDASAQVVRGILSDADAFTAIEGGRVLLLTPELDTLSATITDSLGLFSLRAPGKGDYYVMASALGYWPARSDGISIDEEEVRILELSMVPRPVPVEGLVIETTREQPQIPGLVGVGFYERAAERRGEFIFPGEIARSSATYTQQLFYDKKLVRVQQHSHERPGIWNDVVRIRNIQGRYCRPSMYIDGVHVPRLNPGESIADAAPKRELEAVEIYQWPFDVPIRYRARGDCGVILFWTRNR